MTRLCLIVVPSRRPEENSGQFFCPSLVTSHRFPHRPARDCPDRGRQPAAAPMSWTPACCSPTRRPLAGSPSTASSCPSSSSPNWRPSAIIPNWATSPGRHCGYLDDLRITYGRLDADLPIGEQGGTIRVELNHTDPQVLPAGFRLGDNDTRILSVARSLAAEGDDVVLVSKDLPLRVKAASIGLTAQEYRAELPPDSGWTGMAELDLTPGEIERAVPERASRPARRRGTALPHRAGAGRAVGQRQRAGPGAAGQVGAAGPGRPGGVRAARPQRGAAHRS